MKTDILEPHEVEALRSRIKELRRRLEPFVRQQADQEAEQIVRRAWLLVVYLEALWVRNAPTREHLATFDEAERNFLGLKCHSDA